MTAPRRNQRRGRRPQGGQRRNPTAEFWRAVPPPDAPEPIRPASDPTALIDSLGVPPLRTHGGTAEHYLAAVVERAAAVAAALAASAGLLALPDDD